MPSEEISFHEKLAGYQRRGPLPLPAEAICVVRWSWYPPGGMRSLLLWLVTLAVSVVASVGCSSQPHCIPGESESCSCVSGRVGAQVCSPEGVFQACTCLEPSPSGGGAPSDGGSDGGSGGGAPDGGGSTAGGAGDGGSSSGEADAGSHDAGGDLDAGVNSFLLSPIAGSTVCGQVAVRLNSGIHGVDAGVAYVSFWLDGTAIGQSSSAPFSWDWDASGTPNGAHAFRATVRDEAGHESSNEVSVTVSNGGNCDNWPVVDVSADIPPFVGRGDGGASGITLRATAEDDIGVSQVEFFEGNRSLGADFSSPYTGFWSVFDGPEGLRQLAFRAEARDGAKHLSVRHLTGSTFVDRTPPLLALDSGVRVGDGGVVVPESVVRYEASDALGPTTVRATCASGRASCASGSCSCSYTQCADSMVVTAVDQAGNTTSRTVGVCSSYPSTAYVPTITSPRNGSTLYRSTWYDRDVSFTLTGTSCGQFSALTVDGRVVFSGFPTASYGGVWYLKWPTGAETAGQHTLTITTYSCGAADAATSASVTVTVQ